MQTHQGAVMIADITSCTALTRDLIYCGMCVQEPSMQTHQGAVMIADITGFTALTEDLGRQGAPGVELLTCCMNNFFTLVIDLVRRAVGENCSMCIRCGPSWLLRETGCSGPQEIMRRGLRNAPSHDLLALRIAALASAQYQATHATLRR